MTQGPFRIAGVDLAAEPAGTALAVVRIGDAVVELEALTLEVDDASIVAAAQGVELVGIDCAFGWPLDFVAFLARHASSEPLGDDATGDLAWRRRLAYRETDRVVVQRTGVRPLSVATDRLGMTALRCSVLLERIAASGLSVDRAGGAPGRSSAVVEVYPALALRLWGLSRPKYKVSADARHAVIADLETAAPWLRLGQHRPLMLRSADALDAVLAALVALAHRGEACLAPAEDQLRAAQVEGWIAVPTGSLAELAPAGWGSVGPPERRGAVA